MSLALKGRLPAGDLPGLGRFHLVAIAGLAAVVVGWQLTGTLTFAAGGFVAFDCLLLGLFNRIADVPEDKENGVRGAGFVEENAGALMRITFVALLVSLVGARPLGTPLLVLRVAFLLGGFAYSFPTVAPRIKEVFLLKNVFAGMLFLVGAVGYPLALREGPARLPEVLALCAFLLPLEITYELIYDLRDVTGDAALRVATVPVKWGAPRTRALIELLLALSAAALLAGYLLGALEWRELAMIAAPVQQALVLRFWIPRQVGRRDALGITWLGGAQLASAIGWIALGLPTARPW